MTVLELIANLQNALQPTASIKQATAWFDAFAMIESDLDSDRRTSKHERELLNQLNSGPSSAMLGLREGREPWLHSTKVALNALKESIERRTTGVDGRPLRE